MSFIHSGVARVTVPVPIVVATSPTAATSAGVPLNGILRGLTAVVPVLDSSATLTVTVKDFDGTVMFSKASIAQNAQTAVLSDASNQPLSIPLGGSHTVTVTASAVQAGDKAITVNLLISK
jgi:hypothetical protein